MQLNTMKNDEIDEKKKYWNVMNSLELMVVEAVISFAKCESLERLKLPLRNSNLPRDESH